MHALRLDVLREEGARGVRDVIIANDVVTNNVVYRVPASEFLASAGALYLDGYNSIKEKVI